MSEFEADISSGLAQLVSNPSLNQCMHPHELHCLEQLLMHHPISSDDARKSIRSGIAILSGLLSRECMTLDILKLFRPLTLDLVGRWKGSMDFKLCPRHDQMIDSLHCGSPKHDLNGNVKNLQSLHLNAIQSDVKQENMASALALILPIAPQITG